MAPTPGLPAALISMEVMTPITTPRLHMSFSLKTRMQSSCVFKFQGFKKRTLIGAKTDYLRFDLILPLKL